VNFLGHYLFQAMFLTAGQAKAPTSEHNPGALSNRYPPITSPDFYDISLGLTGASSPHPYAHIVNLRQHSLEVFLQSLRSILTCSKILVGLAHGFEFRR
jgi:hypothetical protein